MAPRKVTIDDIAELTRQHPLLRKAVETMGVTWMPNEEWEAYETFEEDQPDEWRDHSDED